MNIIFGSLFDLGNNDLFDIPSNNIFGLVESAPNPLPTPIPSSQNKIEGEAIEFYDGPLVVHEDRNNLGGAVFVSLINQISIPSTNTEFIINDVNDRYPNRFKH